MSQFVELDFDIDDVSIEEMGEKLRLELKAMGRIDDDNIDSLRIDSFQNLDAEWVQVGRHDAVPSQWN